MSAPRQPPPPTRASPHPHPALFLYTQKSYDSFKQTHSSFFCRYASRLEREQMLHMRARTRMVGGTERSVMCHESDAEGDAWMRLVSSLVRTWQTKEQPNEVKRPMGWTPQAQQAAMPRLPQPVWMRVQRVKRAEASEAVGSMIIRSIDPWEYGKPRGGPRGRQPPSPGDSPHGKLCTEPNKTVRPHNHRGNRPLPPWLHQ